MNKKNIKKIIIPAIAIIVIIGALVSYFVKPQEVQPVMAPLDTEQDLVEEKEEIPEEPQEDTAIDNKEEEIATETEETVEPEATTDTTHTDITLSEDEYQGDEETDAANMEFTDDEMEYIKQLEAEIIAEHPEWFTDTNPSTGNNSGNYEHVGTPDTGDLGDYQFGSSGQDGLDKNATVY